MFRPVRITPPAELPVSLRDACDHLRIDDGVEDFLVASYIRSATAHLDGFTGILGRCLVDQTWRQDFSDWSCVRLPFPDCKGAVVSWRNDAGTEATVDATNHWLEATARGTELRFKSSWSAPSLPTDGPAPVSVTFTAGYGSALAVPAAIKQAILLMVGHSYRYREAGTDEGVVALPLAFDALITPYRVLS